MSAGPKQAFEYIFGIDLWRDYREKEQQVYESAGIPEDERYRYNPDLSFRDGMEIRKHFATMLVRHAGRNALVMTGIVGVLEATQAVTHGL